MISKDNNIYYFFHFVNVDVLSKQAEKKAEMLVKEYSCILHKDVESIAEDAVLMQKVFMEAAIVDFANDIPGLVVLDDKLITERDSKIIDAIENWTPQHRSKDYLSNYTDRKSAVERALASKTPPSIKKNHSNPTTEDSTRKRVRKPYAGISNSSSSSLSSSSSSSVCAIGSGSLSAVGSSGGSTELEKREMLWSAKCQDEIARINDKYAQGLQHIHREYVLEVEEEQRKRDAVEQKKAIYLAKCLAAFEKEENSHTLTDETVSGAVTAIAQAAVAVDVDSINALPVDLTVGDANAEVGGSAGIANTTASAVSKKGVKGVK